MPTNQWMRPDPALTPPDRSAKRSRRATDGESRSLLEIALAAGGVAAWLWCAYEVARTLFR
ncbi:MAG TPA: hypothetical protein VFC47_06840 [Caulobacteraceae bacterium]|nr:hypothetical protein [Caulobacteraceae bacterium]